jgi:hypothetical protein
LYSEGFDQLLDFFAAVPNGAHILKKRQAV